MSREREREGEGEREREREREREGERDSLSLSPTIGTILMMLVHLQSNPPRIGDYREVIMTSSEILDSDLSPSSTIKSVKTVRQAVGGAPKLNADADSSSGGTSSGEEESENSSPSLATHSTRLQQTSPTPTGPVSSLQAYGFELKEPSIKDSLLYERFTSFYHFSSPSETLICV